MFKNCAIRIIIAKTTDCVVLCVICLLIFRNQYSLQFKALAKVATYENILTIILFHNPCEASLLRIRTYSSYTFDFRILQSTLSDSWLPFNDYWKNEIEIWYEILSIASIDLCQTDHSKAISIRTAKMTEDLCNCFDWVELSNNHSLLHFNNINLAVLTAQ